MTEELRTDHFQTALILAVNSRDEQKQLARDFLHQYSTTIPNFGITWINEDGLGIKIKDIRAMIQELAFGSIQGQDRAIVLLGAETASVAAQNALLKSLEEPPQKTLLMLVTAYPTQLLPTIRSRCHINYSLVTHTPAQSNWQDLQNLYQQIISAQTFSELIDLSSNYSKREQANLLIEQLMAYLTHHLLKQKITDDDWGHRLVSNLQALTGCHDLLSKNCNPRLAVENCLFEMHSAHR